MVGFHCGLEVDRATWQLPERALPGVVIQEDSIKNLAVLLRDAEVQFDEGHAEEAMEVVHECLEIVLG